jgi:hypothetical protein
MAKKECLTNTFGSFSKFQSFYTTKITLMNHWFQISICITYILSVLDLLRLQKYVHRILQLLFLQVVMFLIVNIAFVNSCATNLVAVLVVCPDLKNVDFACLYRIYLILYHNVHGWEPL